RRRRGSAEGPPLPSLLHGLGHRARRAVRPRHRQCERRTLTFVRLHGDVAAVGLGDVPDDRQPEPGSTGVTTSRPVDAVEALEDAFEITRGDPDPVIAYDERDAVSVDACADLDRRARSGV